VSNEDLCLVTVSVLECMLMTHHFHYNEKIFISRLIKLLSLNKHNSEIGYTSLFKFVSH